MEAAVPLFGILFALIVVVASLFVRYGKEQMAHKERLAALEKGIAIPGRSAPWPPRVYLLRGLVWSFSGVAFSVCLVGISATTRMPVAYSTLGLVPLAVGLAYLVFYYTDESRKKAAVRGSDPPTAGITAH